MKRLLITICGRAGSKGFKNKNLKNFCGKPLVYYSLSAAELFIKKHPELEIDVALNTDSEDLARLVAAEYPDAALVCTAPLAHAAVIGELLDHDLPVFTELNLVSDGYRENMAKAAAKKLPLFLSSTMLYRRETQYIKQQVAEFGKPVHYIYHIGQYLPDWHPWENYKNFFVGNARTGGVREIFGIDLPWLLDAFGDVESVTVQKDTISDLGLPYPDCVTLLLRHKGGVQGVLAADVVKFVVAQGHGVVGHEGVDVGQHGPFVGCKKQGSLKLVASIECQHVVVVCAHAFHGGGKAGQPAGTAL